MRAGNLSVAVKRLEKAVCAIAKLGKIMSIRVSPAYHQLRIRELELVADYQAKVAEEKEAERAERERLREEAKARREYEQEQDRLTRELSHYRNALVFSDDAVGLEALHQALAPMRVNLVNPRREFFLHDAGRGTSVTGRTRCCPV